MFPTDGFKSRLVDGQEYTGMRMEVMGLASVVKYTPGPDEVCISIHTDHYGYEKPDLIAQGFVDVLPLEFDDTEIDRKNDPDAKPYNETIAKKVAEFVLKNKDKKKLVLHCFAGMSRSRSMAAGIVDGLRREHDIGLPYSWTFLNRPVYLLTSRAFNQKTEKDELPNQVYERKR